MTHFTLDAQAIATTELYSHLEQQVQEVAPEPTDPVVAQIRRIKSEAIGNALTEGECFWQAKQSFKKLKDFKLWLSQQGFIWKNACKQIKLYEVFAKFPLQQIGWLSLDTLYSLCQPKYQVLLEQLRSLPRWMDTKIQELMQQIRQERRKVKPKLEEILEEPGSGWRRLPGGGRAYQLPLIHEDWLGTLIDASCKARNQTLTELIRDMTLFFVEWLEVPGIDFFRSQPAENFS